MPTIVHFDLPAEDTSRARTFYESLFDWKFNKWPGPMDFYLIETTDLNGGKGLGGGLGRRQAPGQTVTNYVGVDSLDDYVKKVEALGGKVLQSRMEVRGYGAMAVCIDPEGNPFGLWQAIPK